MLLSENVSHACWCHDLGHSLMAFMKLTNNNFAVPCFHTSGEVYMLIDPGENGMKQKELSVL